MDIKIRDCKIEDSKDIYNLNKDSLNHEFSRDIIEENLKKIINNNNYKSIVAEVNNNVVGYIQAHEYISLYQEPLIDIIALAVNQNYQGKGVGRKLVQNIEDWAKEKEAKGLRLVSRIDRIDAHEFYKKLGFKEIKLQKNLKKYF